MGWFHDWEGFPMRWRGRRQSTNVQDRRGSGGGFGRMGFPMGMGRSRIGRGGGIGGLGLIAIVVIALLFGVDPGVLLTGGQGPVDSPVDSPMTRSAPRRSEEHTSELQSLMRTSYAVFSLKK